MTFRLAVTARDVVVPDVVPSNVAVPDAAPSGIAVSVAPSDVLPLDTAPVDAVAPDRAPSDTAPLDAVSDDAPLVADVSWEDSRRGVGWGCFTQVSLACSGWAHPMSGPCSRMWRRGLHFDS